MSRLRVGSGGAVVGRLVFGSLLAAARGGSNVELQSIGVAPSGYSVEQGVQLQATATGRYSDGTTKDLTATVR